MPEPKINIDKFTSPGDQNDFKIIKKVKKEEISSDENNNRRNIYRSKDNNDS